MTDQKNTDSDKRIALAKIYLKDMSFESPQAPDVFKSAGWSPKTNLNLRSTHTALEDNHEDKTLFLVELQQAGLFEIAGYSQDEMSHIVGSFCPGALFPYAREAIATTIQRGGFPEFLLQPINFDALYMQALQQRAAQAGGQPAPETH
jgi:preprotein translocase subunit SecB